MTIYEFPPLIGNAGPQIEATFPLADKEIHREIDPRDRVVFDGTSIEVTDDETDQFVALPVRVGVHFGEPTIEVGKYSMPLAEARQLAGSISRFAGQFRAVSA